MSRRISATTSWSILPFDCRIVIPSPHDALVTRFHPDDAPLLQAEPLCCLCGHRAETGMLLPRDARGLRDHLVIRRGLKRFGALSLSGIRVIGWGTDIVPPRKKACASASSIDWIAPMIGTSGSCGDEIVS